MSFFSRSSGKRQHRDNHQGSNYYKREGFLSRILKMFGSFSNSKRNYNNHHSHSSHSKHYSNQKHHKKRYKSSWS